MRLEGWDFSGYKASRAGHRFRLSERALEMLKVAACLAFVTWMASCVMLAVYSREIAVFMVERMQ